MTIFCGDPLPADADTEKRYWERIDAFEPMTEVFNREKVSVLFDNMQKLSPTFDVVQNVIKNDIHRTDKFVLNGETLYTLGTETEKDIVAIVYENCMRALGNNQQLTHDVLSLSTQSITQGSTGTLYESCYHQKFAFMPVNRSREVVIKTQDDLQITHHMIMAIKTIREHGPIHFRYLDMNLNIRISIEDLKEKKYTGAVVEKVYTAFHKWLKPQILTLEDYQKYLKSFKGETRGFTESDIEDAFQKVYASSSYGKELTIMNSNGDSFHIPDHFCSYIKKLSKMIINKTEVPLPSELSENEKAKLIALQYLIEWPDDIEAADLLIHCPTAPFIHTINQEMHACFNCPQFLQFVFLEEYTHSVQVHNGKVTIENQLLYAIKNPRQGNGMSIDGYVRIDLKMVIPKDIMTTKNYSAVCVERTNTAVLSYDQMD